MVQSESNKQTIQIKPPPRRFTIELLVGLFTLVGVFCAGLLAIGLGGEALFTGSRTEIYAEFDNISGLEKGASVEIGGVPIGEVTEIRLQDPKAIVTLLLHEGVSIRDDDIALIRTKGIIGDRYVKISRGASDIFLKPGDTIKDTESVVDIEDLIGKIVHNFTGDKSKE
jgi:phospholipid/cholesterol/gamma-HCH transport system substrate-binding protein